MKIKILRSVICIAFNSVLLAGFAQTQSMQLPIPSENASVINFTDPANPVLTNLPVFPNPSDGNVFVEYNLSNSQTGTFTVYTATGSPVLTVNLKTGLNTISIDEKMLSEGVYYYQTIVGSNDFSSGKLMIIK